MTDIEEIQALFRVRASSARRRIASGAPGKELTACLEYEAATWDDAATLLADVGTTQGDAGITVLLSLSEIATICQALDIAGRHAGHDRRLPIARAAQMLAEFAATWEKLHMVRKHAAAH